jgi:hypothetical protein
MALKHANVSCIAWSETGPVKDGWAAASPMAVIQVMASTADCAVFRVRTGVKDDTVMIFRAQWSMTEFFRQCHYAPTWLRDCKAAQQNRRPANRETNRIVPLWCSIRSPDSSPSGDPFHCGVQKQELLDLGPNDRAMVPKRPMASFADASYGTAPAFGWVNLRAGRDTAIIRGHDAMNTIDRSPPAGLVE